MAHRPIPLRVTVHWSHGEAAAALCGELDRETVPAAIQRLRQILEQRPARLVVDLSAVSLPDEARAIEVIKVIVSARQAASPGDIPVILRSPSQAIRRVIEVSGLDQVCAVENAVRPAHSPSQLEGLAIG